MKRDPARNADESGLPSPGHDTWGDRGNPRTSALPESLATIAGTRYEFPEQQSRLGLVSPKGGSRRGVSTSPEREQARRAAEPDSR